MKNRDIPIGYVRKIWLVMRLTTVILLASLLQVSASALAQKISLTKSNAPLKTVLKEIKQQSGYDFIATASLFKAAKPVTINIKDVDFEAALKLLFSDQPLTYSINNTTVTIKEKAPSVTSVILNSFQNLLKDLNVKGRVVDQDGKPLPNASIRVKGKSAVTNTNTEGEFEIKGVADDAVLLVSYVGFRTLELPLKDAVMPLEIKLNVATGELEEVKIVYDDGYQKLNKERSTGSFVHIDNELFNRAVGTNVLDRILNVTSGLASLPELNNDGFNSGLGSGITIRGFSTINASKAALIIVDNFPYEGNLNTLNPNDVESITVLKDAAAASIWGVRAGNGVIVITTKKGKFNQATKIGFNSNVTIGEKPDLFYTPYMSSKDVIDFQKKQFALGMYDFYDDATPSLKNPTLPQAIEILLDARRQNKEINDYNALNDPIVNSRLDDLEKGDLRNDISKYLLRNSINQQYALNLSGGAGAFNYYASIGYDKNRSGTIKADNDRISLNLSNVWKPVKRLEISSNLVHTISNFNDATVDIGLTNSYPIYTRLADRQGNPLTVPSVHRLSYVDTVKLIGLFDWHYKPLEDYEYVDNRNQSYDTRISAVMKYTVRPWLVTEFQYQNQITQSNVRNKKEQQSFAVRNRINTFMSKDASGKIIYPFPLGDVVDLSHTTFKAWNVRGSLKFDKQFGDHAVSSFVGVELRETTNESNSSSLYGYDPETNTSVPISFTQTYTERPNGGLQTLASIQNPISILTRNGSFFGNAAYNFKGKYLATISGRMDQSNFFGVKANLRRVPLWSTGLAWNLHLEDFYKIDWLDVLKFKISYGYTGNTNSGVSSYATIKYNSVGNTGAPLMSSVPYSTVLTPNNPQLRWERVKVINTGIDFSFKNNRINGSLEFYQKTGLDLLGPVVTDPTTGVSQFTGNRASMKGKGMDIVLNTHNIVSENFEWNTILNVSLNQDKIVAYEGVMQPPSNKPGGGGIEVGDPLLALYSYQWAGLDPVNGDPRIYLGDTITLFSNYSKAKKEDLVFHGQLNPRFYGSIINRFGYKQFSISANIIYEFGHYFRRSSINYNRLFSTGFVGHNDYSKRWMKGGDEQYTNVPSLPSNANNNRDHVYSNADILAERADHIRLQDIKINYTINSNILKRLQLKNLSLYLYVANLGILWRANKQRIDPRFSSFGGTSPTPKTIAFGLNANF